MIKKFIKENYFIGLCAFSQCIATFSLFCELERHHFFYAMAVGVATKVVYSILRNAQKLLNTIARRKLLLHELPFGLLAFTFLLFSDLNGLQYSILCMMLVLSIFYGIHIFGTNTKNISLRQPGIVKLTTISVVWVVTCSVLPFLLCQAAYSTPSILFFMTQFLFLMALTIPFDFTDVQTQKALGFPTLVSKYGKPTAKKIARSIALIAWLIAGFVSIPYFFIMSGCVLLFINLLYVNTLNQKNFITYVIQFDGLLLIQGLLLIAMQWM